MLYYDYLMKKAGQLLQVPGHGTREVSARQDDNSKKKPLMQVWAVLFIENVGDCEDQRFVGYEQMRDYPKE